jgi:type I restriction enzyme, S subunit
MEVRSGYKQTELGMIPEDWDIVFLDTIAAVTSGKRLPLGRSLTDDETPHPYLRVVDMRSGGVSLADIKYVPTDVFPAIKRYRIYKEDIFISVAGTLGIVGVIPPELDGANLTENADRITSIACSQIYLLHILMSPIIQRTIDAIKTVGAQPKLALARIRKFDIPLPPSLAEQEAIAEALSDADALIESLEQLIAKKRQIKQGAMQELLTGKRRLEGFSGEWETKKLGELAVLSRINVNPATFPDCLYSHFSLPAFDAGAVPVIEEGRQIGSNKFSVPENAVLMSKLNPRIPRVWLPKKIPNNSVCSTEFLVLVPSVGMDRRFLEFLCASETVQKYMELHAIGTTGSHQRIHPSIALGAEVMIPRDEDEQSAIVAILSDVGEEMSLIETKLVKARQIKQGMMQELLTGRIRLV